MDSRPAAVPALIRRAVADDVEALAAITSHADVFPHLLQMPHGDAAQWRQRLSDTFGPSSGNLLLVAVVDGRAVGAVDLHPAHPSPRRRHAMGLGMYVHPEAQGRGVGTQLLQAVCDYADRWVGVSRLELNVYTDNLVAQRLYRRFGFIDEGVQRAYALRDGRYVDSLRMARLHATPPLAA
ncbi:GNAT family N-acetyltransferase [Rhizobacter sp. LjRoot28]|uniref:GNAT family N-acetyltransferase n=1 Tax=Rhizobacter sp. LjRoot28 TaxID=3342309 RepID=UPI003ECDC346